MSSSFGLHEITFHPVPDSVLLKLDPLVHVIVGTYQNASESVGRADHVCRLLPKATVVLRLWPDDHQYNQITPEQWAAAYLPFASRDKWYLSINNEPLSGAPEEAQIIAVRDWELQVIKLANKAGVRIAYGAFSTGTPYHTYYKHLVPVWREAALLGARQHVWRPNCYYDPQDPSYKENHLFRPIIYGWKAAADAGIDPPFTIYGETGIAHRYNPDEGYKTAGLSGRQYAQQLVSENLPVSAAVFCWGPWRNNSYSVDSDPDFIDELALRGKSTSVIPGFPNANNQNWQGARLKSTGTYTNIRSIPSTNGTIIGRLTSTPSDGKINRIERWLNNMEGKYWYPILVSNIKGWVREDVFTSSMQIPGDAVWSQVRLVNSSNIVDVPYGVTRWTEMVGSIVDAALDNLYSFSSDMWVAIRKNGTIGWTRLTNVASIPNERIFVVPYYSYHGIGGHSRPPEAYVACARMVIGWANISRGLKDMHRPTISDLLSFVDLEPGDNVNSSHLLTMLEIFGVKSVVASRITPASLDAIIDGGTPVMTTISYGLIPNRQDMGTTGTMPIVIVGKSNQDIVIHDPNWRGADIMLGSYWKINKNILWNAINAISNPMVILPLIPSSGQVITI